jgi:hypothetical protein
LVHGGLLIDELRRSNTTTQPGVRRMHGVERPRQISRKCPSCSQSEPV